MYNMPSAPKSIGGVLDDLFQLYRQSFWQVWPFALLSIAVSVGATLAMTWRLLAGGVDTNVAVMQLISNPRLWLGGLALLLVALWLYAVQLVRAHAVAEGNSLPWPAALTRGLSVSPAIVLATLVYLLVLLVTLLLPGFGAAMVAGISGATGGWSLMVLAIALLLSIPFFVVYITYYFYMAAVVVDDTGPFSGLGRSRNVVRGNWWRTTAILTVGLIIFFVVYLASSLLAGVLTIPVRDPLTNALVSQILSGIFSSAAMPLLPVLTLVTYYDLKLRKLGGDLAKRVDALAVSS